MFLERPDIVGVFAGPESCRAGRRERAEQPLGKSQQPREFKKETDR